MIKKKNNIVVKNSRNYIKNEMNGLQIYDRIVESFTLTEFADILNDRLLLAGSIVFTGAIIKEGLNLFKKYLIYFYNSNSLNNPYTNNENYSNLKELYNQYTEEIANYFKSLGLNDVISIFNYFTYIVKESGLSYTDQFKLGNPKDDVMVSDLLGTNIVLGEGCCRHLSSLLSDIYNKMGYNSELLVGRMQDGIFLKTPIINHAVTIVEDKEGNIIMDPTIGIIRKINNKKTSTEKSMNMKAKLVRDKFDFSFSYGDGIALDFKDDFFIKNGTNKDFTCEDIINSSDIIDEIKDDVPSNYFKEKNKVLIKSLFISSNKIYSKTFFDAADKF